MISAQRKWLYPAWAQAIFYTTTGLWPIFEVDSFMVITGPKVDVWLVRTVGLLLALTGVLLGWLAAKKRFVAEVVWLAMAQAASLIAVDVIYASIGRISKIYLLDAVAEALLIVFWLVCWPRRGSPD